MIKKLFFTLSLCMLAGGVLYAQSTIKGEVKGPDGYGVPYLQILLKQEGRVINGAYTDDLGAYQIFGVPAGTYDITAGGTMTCPTLLTQKGIYVSASEVKFVDLTINCSSTELKEVEVQYVPPVFDKDNTTSTQKLTGEEVRKSPGRSITRVLANLDGVASQDGNIASVRGNRSDGHQTIIDGVRVRGQANVPMQSVEGLELIQGGIPAEYGDGTSFAIITTRGVSKDFNGGIELLGSLEGYNQFMLSGNVSGPLLKGKTAQDPPRMGFLISAEASYEKDPRPLHGGSWVAKPEVIENLLAKPIEYRLSNGEYVAMYRANGLEKDAFQKIRVRENARDWNALAQGKIDIMGGGKDARGRAKNNLRFSISGTYEYASSLDWGNQRSALFNSASNLLDTRSTMRLSARLNHRVKTDTAANAILRNVMYDINVNYTLFQGKQEDQKHKDNFFGYGYVGQFKTERADTYEPTQVRTANPGDPLDTALYSVMALADHQAVSWVTFNPNTYMNNGNYYNKDLLPYMVTLVEHFKEVYGIDINDASEEDRARFRMIMRGLPSSYEVFDKYNALYNGGFLDQTNSSNRVLANGLYVMPGTQNTPWQYQKWRQESIGARLSLSLNIKNHEVKFGFELEKLTNRSYAIQASNLWNRMRSLTYYHVYMKDLDNPYWISGPDGPRWGMDDFGEWYINDTLMYGIITEGLANFDLNFRNAHNITTLDNYLDIDSYDPAEFKLEWLSNFEMLNLGHSIVDYNGYDYLGNISRKKMSLTDFFSGEDVHNKDKYAIGAYEPIYFAFYLQDKFSISNLLFNVGLRLDYFNANQYVLKDPFLLRDAHNVQDLIKEGWNIPADNVQPDWIPYVADVNCDINNAPHAIVAYRNGKTWYNDKGQEVSDPTSYLGAGGPVLKEIPKPDAVSKVTFGAFKKYKPIVQPMPRISFSFPVSTNSLFYAHYNIITYRPTRLEINPIAYLFISEYQSDTRIITNPNLRANRKIDYEIGFKQRVGENAALSFSAFYTEQRDLIQSYRYTGAYPNTYYSFENADFGTVQGLILGINMRGTKNLSFRAGYTLQFAKGTGSSPESNKAFIASGQPNLRTLTNLDFDQRHKISANINFSFDSGTNYNGPTIRKQKKNSETVKEIRWLENSGATLMIAAGSGMPYSRSAIVYSVLGWGSQKEPQLQGNVNGANMPWTIQCDLRLDKTFIFNLAKKNANESGKRKNKPGFLTVYLDFQNLLNLKNAIRVYDYTGSADTDGYLTSPLFNTSIDKDGMVSGLSVDIARNYYDMLIANPFNYNQPFRVKLGVQFSF